MIQDPSTDYVNYPTLAPVPVGTLSRNAFVSCPICGGTGFRLRRIDMTPVCMDCKYALDPLEMAPEAPVQEPEALPVQLQDDLSQEEAPFVVPGAVSVPRFQILRGPDHTVILRPDGTVKAVGNNKNGQCNVQDWKNIVSIATNQFYTVGVCENGTVQLAGGSWMLRNKLSSWKNVTTIVSGHNFFVGLCADGTMKSNGIRLPVWSGITAISAGDTHFAALCEDGSVRAVGSNAGGMCKVQDWSRITAIALGSQHTVGLCEDGTVKAVGFNKKSKQEPIPRCNVEKWTRIIAVAAGNSHTVGLHEGGWVFAVGSNANGQCDVSDWTNVVAICAGENFTAGLRSDGTVLCTDPTIRKLLAESYS